jgi:hypothetical protein
LTLEDGKIFHACVLVELTLSKWPYYQGNLHVQCNPYQNSNDILHINRKINLERHMEAQITSNSQSDSYQNVQH